MSAKEITKQAFELAEKEARERKVAEVKAIVTETLKKLEQVRQEIKEKQEEERILKLDIEDLKNGKLDLIAERQAKDLKAKEVSVVLIIKEKEVIREVPVYYWPYHIYWQIPVPVYVQPVFTVTQPWCGATSNAIGGTLTSNTVGSFSNVIDCSVAKDATIGAYSINGHIVHLR